MAEHLISAWRQHVNVSDAVAAEVQNIVAAIPNATVDTVFGIGQLVMKNVSARVDQAEGEGGNNKTADLSALSPLERIAEANRETQGRNMRAERKAARRGGR